MKSKLKITGLLCMFLLLTAVPVRAAIPVHDSAAFLKIFDFLEDILEKYKDEIGIYRDIIKIKDKYIREMRQIIYRSETLFNAVTYFPKTVPGQYTLNPYVFDRLQKNIWGRLFEKDGKIEDQYPEIGDFGYITNNSLYRGSPRFREYADRVLRFKQDEKQELDNDFGLVKYMREFEQERADLLDRFKGVIVPAFGAEPGEADEKKVVDVTKLYYAIGMAKLEVLKQQLEMLLMEKEIMEKFIKDEVNAVRHMILNQTYFQNNGEE